MPSLKDLKLRIETVKSTRKITRAMQMVAAAKLRRAQEAAESARPYAEHLNAIMANLSAGAAGSGSAPPALIGTGQDQIHLLIAATSERGLCGGFNSSIVRLVRSHLRQLRSDGKTVKIITIGKKGREQLKRDCSDLVIDHVDLSGYRAITYDIAQKIAEDVMRRFEAGEFDVGTVFFSRFRSVISQMPTAMQLIPARVDAPANDTGTESRCYEYEPGEDEILAELVPRAIANQIFTALLENSASEQGARMSAMDNATRNAGEMIDKLTIVYNRSRQAAITKELIEIISGAEAL
ncbi:MAG: F0F1 ATP synthase subunit gamma [Rhodobacteraceae bacterium]|nr:F0F1 ATP synthase subunit gamma [Paracoccaceae bacterium]